MNPYALLVVVVAFAASLGWGALEHAQIQDLELTIDQQKIQAANDLVDAQAKAANIQHQADHTINVLNLKVTAHEDSLSALHAANAALLDQLRRRSVARRGGGGDNPGAPSAAIAAGGGPVSPPAGAVSTAIADPAAILGDAAARFAAAADDAALVAGTCKTALLTVTQLYEGLATDGDPKNEP